MIKIMTSHLITSVNEIEYEPVVWAMIKAEVFILIDVIGSERKHIINIDVAYKI